MSLRSIKSLLLDKELRGLWVSLAAHAVVLLIVFVGFEFSSPETHISPINAVQAVAIDNRSENRKKLQEQKQAQRKKDKAKQAEEQKRKQEKLKKEKLKKEKLKQEKLEKEKLKQQKEDKRKKAEAKAAEAKKQLLAKQKLEAKKVAEAKQRAADKKAAEVKRKAEVERKQAEAAEFERQQQEEQRLLDEEKRQEKLKAEQAAEEAAARARQEDIDRAIYQQEIARYMTQHWIKPPNTKTGYFCEVIIMQSRGGHVLDVNVVACNGDAAFRASVERAANKPDQLPLPSNPDVFESKVRILFEEK